MYLNEFTAISPIDGRYRDQTKNLSLYFSEYALNKWRIYVEVEYFISLIQNKIITDEELDDVTIMKLKSIHQNFSQEDCSSLKIVESYIKHDVKSLEYLIKEKISNIGLSHLKEFIHFGLTSQDINNTAIPLSIKKWFENIYLVEMDRLIDKLIDLSESCGDIVMLSRTHGQPASPTKMSKEIMVFVERLQNQIDLIKNIKFYGKFGGAVGNFNAHKVAYPNVDWKKFSDDFLKSFGLKRLQYTTQIDHYDNLSTLFDNLKRINIILMDFCKDIWQYISMDYFSQKSNSKEVGSSVMPHKINPIDFENAEGNLGMSNALLQHLSEKLPISRLQRDLTDSTVLRNVGVPIGHIQISLNSIKKGLTKLVINEEKINQDLEDNWVIISEGIQTILRREGFNNPYETLKGLTRGGEKIGREDIWNFIDGLDVNENVKNELKELSPFNYFGV
jgi:adenylosuccinate lyase